MTDSLASLAADLAKANMAIGPAIRPIVRRNAATVRDEWRGTWPWTSKHLPKMAAAITFETSSTAVSAQAEIGPKKGPGEQGSLGHIIEFGSVKSPPHPAGGPAAMKVAPVFEAELAAVATFLLGAGASALGARRDPSRYNPGPRGAAWPGFED